MDYFKQVCANTIEWLCESRQTTYLEIGVICVVGNLVARLF